MSFSPMMVLIALAVASSTVVGCAGGTGAPPADKVPITTSSPNALKEYLRGRDLAEKLRATDARERFAAALAQDPDFALAYLGLANTAPTTAEFFDALRRATACADKVSEGEKDLILATEAAANSRPDEQLRRLTALVRAYPNDERAHNQLGLYHFGRQEWKQAAAEFRRATEINPEFSAPYNQLGYALRYLDDFAGAERAFTTYIQLIPKEPNPYDSYAELLMKMGRFRESIAQYEKALSINPNFVASYVGMGNDYIFLGQPLEARNSFTKLAFIARNDGERRRALVWTAISYLHEGRTEKALDEVARMDEIARRNDDKLAMAGDLTLAGNILLEAGRADDAAARFNEAVATAQAAIVTADVKETVQRNNLFNLARVALLRNDLASAASIAERYATLVNQRKIPFEIRQVHELFGLVALARREWSTAVAELEQANQQDPRVLLNLSRAYAGAGQGEAARRALAGAAHFNGLGLNYAFVRAKALAMLAAP
jgi:tetratricopeptide (TPR) repeat protein